MRPYFETLPRPCRKKCLSCAVNIYAFFSPLIHFQLHLSLENTLQELSWNMASQILSSKESHFADERSHVNFQMNDPWMQKALLHFKASELKIRWRWLSNGFCIDLKDILWMHWFEMYHLNDYCLKWITWMIIIFGSLKIPSILSI